MRPMLALCLTALTLPALAATPTAGQPPQLEPVYQAIVDIAPSQALGTGPLGERRMVPIIGGTFEGKGLSGKVLPGGADRQLVRSDGVKQLDAVYEMQTDDGAVLSVRNQVLVHGEGAQRYAMSHITVVAPEGRYGWLNQSVFVGTLTSLKPARNAVRIDVFRVH